MFIKKLLRGHWRHTLTLRRVFREGTKSPGFEAPIGRRSLRPWAEVLGRSFRHTDTGDTFRRIGPRGCGGALDVGVSPGVCKFRRLGSPVLVTSWDTYMHCHVVCIILSSCSPALVTSWTTYIHALPRGVHSRLAVLQF